jgi:hypothetical protein
VTIDEFALRRVLDQLAQQQPSRLYAPGFFEAQNSMRKRCHHRSAAVE